MKQFKFLALILALAMIVGIFAGCASGGNTDSTTKGNDTTAAPTTKGEEGGDKAPASVHFTMSGLPSADRTEELERYHNRQAEYEEKTGNTYELVTFQYDYQTFAAMLEGGNLPTEFAIANTEPQILIKNGWGKDITDIVNEYGYAEHWNPTLRELVSDKDGRIYGVPNSAYSLCLVANKSVFRQAGLVDENDNIIYPKTWDELIETCRTIVAKTDAKGMSFTICDNMGGWNFSNVAWNYGADLCVMNDDGSYTSNLNSEAVVKAATVYQTLSKEGLLYGDVSIDRWDDCLTNVSEGLSAMAFFHNGCAFGICDDQGTQNMDVENLCMIPIPGGPAGNYWLMGGDTMWFSPDATDEQVRAWFEYNELYGRTPNVNDDQIAAMKEDANLRVNERGSVYTPDITAYTSGDWYDAYMQVVEEYRNWKWEDMPVYEWAEKNPAHVEEEGMCQQMYATLTSALQEIVLYPDKDIQAILDEAQSAYQAILDTSFDVQK